MESVDSLARKYVVRFGIPRPADCQHFSPFRTAVVFMGACTQGMALVAAGVISAVAIWLTFGNLGLSSMLWRLGAVGAGFFALCVAFIETTALAFPYNRVNQRESHGAGRWASAGDLKAHGLLGPRGVRHAPRSIKIGEYADCFRRFDLVVPLEQMFGHVAVFGPPGSGKSESFFVPVIRQWTFGAVFAVDTKGELYEKTARYFEPNRVFRLDLENPKCSDRLNLVSACLRNPEIAHELASIIVGLDESAKTAREPFWPQAETALCSALLMYLPLVYDRPHPGLILELLSKYPDKSLGGKLAETGDRDVIAAWNLFSQADEKLQGSIRIGLSTVLNPFATPHASNVLTPATVREREAGVRDLDLEDFRRPGTAVYLVVAEGTATRLQSVLSTIIAAVQTVCRRTGSDPNATPVLFAADEVGNISVQHLSERVGVGRGLRTCYFLGWQGKGQAHLKYGEAGTDAILASIGTLIFLPGTDLLTGRFAAFKAGPTTTLTRTNVDAVGKALDNVRLAETGRDLIDAAGLREMRKHVEMIAIVATAPPIHCAIPRPVRSPRLTHRVPYAIDLSKPPDAPGASRGAAQPEGRPPAGNPSATAAPAPAQVGEQPSARPSTASARGQSGSTQPSLPLGSSAIEIPADADALRDSRGSGTPRPRPGGSRDKGSTEPQS